ncbi:hypothetical protein ACVWZR_004589 [Bradyrhizobium sp. i1.3.1]
MAVDAMTSPGTCPGQAGRTTPRVAVLGVLIWRPLLSSVVLLSQPRFACASISSASACARWAAAIHIKRYAVIVDRPCSLVFKNVGSRVGTGDSSDLNNSTKSSACGHAGVPPLGTILVFALVLRHPLTRISPAYFTNATHRG